MAWVRTAVPRTALVLADLEPQLWEGADNIHAAQFVSPLLDQPLEWFAGHRYSYLVLNEDRVARFQREPARYPRQVAAYERLLAETEEIARFDAANGHSGPPIRVLRLEMRADRLVMGQRLATRLGTIDLLGATLGPVTRLDDIAVARAGAAAPVRAGGILGLTLYWRPTAALDADFTVFVHVLDAQGRTVAQRDTPPVGGRSPTSGWQPGQIVIDPANVPLPAGLAPGTYRVVVGLYQPADGRRLPVQPANPELSDAVEVGRVRVTR
jgi:hypothetical protein